MLVQNAVLTYVVNSLIELIEPNLAGFPSFPLCCTAVVAMVVACASMPHYLFAGRPFPLFVIAAAHDTAQLAAAIFTIYLLN